MTESMIASRSIGSHECRAPLSDGPHELFLMSFTLFMNVKDAALMPGSKLAPFISVSVAL